MKRRGVVGGIGPESTIAYCRSIIAAARRVHPASGAAPVLITSIDVQKVLRLLSQAPCMKTTAGRRLDRRSATREGGKQGRAHFRSGRKTPPELTIRYA